MQPLKFWNKNISLDREMEPLLGDVARREVGTARPGSFLGMWRAPGYVVHPWGDSRVSPGLGVPEAGMAVRVPRESVWELSRALFPTAWSEKSRNIKEYWCVLLRSGLGGSGLVLGLGISLQGGNF